MGPVLPVQKSISRHIYLRNIQDANETLFYNLLRSHMKETLPIIYTPRRWVKYANIFQKYIAEDAACSSPAQSSPY